MTSKKKTQNKERSKYVALNNKKVLTESKTILHDAMIDSSLTQDAMCACFFFYLNPQMKICVIIVVRKNPSGLSVYAKKKHFAGWFFVIPNYKTIMSRKMDDKKIEPKKP